MIRFAIHRHAFKACAFVVLAMVTTNAKAGNTSISVLPKSFQLHHANDVQRLTTVEVLTTDSDTSATTFGGRIETVTYKSCAPEIAKVVNGTVQPVSAGTAKIVARDEKGRSSTCVVTVKNIGDSHQWSFRNDVQSVFSKVGCNMGACHGALAGKGGFRLSLRGYDAIADFASITREARGRRVEMADPGRSLLLTKPTGVLPHKGGLRLDPNSRDYKILSQWIANGCRPPTSEDAKLQKIAVLPANATLKPGQTSQVLVQAHYDDGSVVDVTHWSRFTATDEAIAGVDENGLVTIRQAGQAAISVWFGSKIALARVTVPFPHQIDPSVYQTAQRRNFIDDLNLQQLETLRLRPSPTCDDATFLRRATIDTVGRLPNSSERDGYYAERESDRRDWLIERLLSDEDFVDYWTYKWSDVLLINGNRLRPAGVKSYYDWLHDAIQDDTPWDELAREILTSKGSIDENGATNFYALNQTPEDMTENACQAFMGLSIGCAKCHNHPLEKWTNDQYYAMANLFSRVRAKGWGGDSRNGDGKRQIFVSTTGELVQPNRGKPQKPAPLDAPPIEFDDPRDRREILAQWMTSPDNPYFARSITNRIWANYFGRGLIEAVDDLRLSNPASNEAMLSATADYLVDSKFDLKSLMRAILQSKTYQRSSLPLAENRDENRFNSRYYPRRMMAEVLLDSIDQVLGTSTSFTKIAFSGADKQDTDFYKAGTRAIELYDSAVDSYFLKTFGRNPREITCECERDDEPSMVQVLHLSNGETLNPKLQDPSAFPTKALSKWSKDTDIVDAIFELALFRQPSAQERDRMVKLLGEYDDRKTAIADLTWSILTSTEFTFNH